MKHTIYIFIAQNFSVTFSLTATHYHFFFNPVRVQSAKNAKWLQLQSKNYFGYKDGEQFIINFFKE